MDAYELDDPKHETFYERSVEVWDNRDKTVPPPVVHTCPGCASHDTVGPFEMDGVLDGTYHATGLYWITCRACGRTTRTDREP